MSSRVAGLQPRPRHLLGVNEAHSGRYWTLAQVDGLRWSVEVGNGRQGCCTFVLYRVWLLTLSVNQIRACCHYPAEL